MQGTADVKAFRNPNSMGLLTPDSAVMVDGLFRDAIASYAFKGKLCSSIKFIWVVAVQLKSEFAKRPTPEPLRNDNNN